ncbi:inner membrane protein YpjD [Rheinheimera sp. MMS21-TC3]|uniref:cytochrome C assembly family protein n=1 Tax=Rheinheimera sp. MMS21-TC3 TaxID=3072790 RepID=UPI0028C382F2|nr:cytochrome c biogenesis protein CcsA [Rheinheimera sp. MMS21-TC3]WNO61754.1 cytochrome c biogenesis protein CcsA [Rheinheimera sp. MMS21-TC3]
MHMSPVLLSALALIAYLIATASVLLRIFHPAGPHFKTTFSAASIAIVLHMFALTALLFTDNGQNFSLLNVVSLICWLITVAITLAALRSPAILLLPVVYGFACLTQLATLITPQYMQIQHFEQHISILAHIFLAFIAYAVLIMAMLYSLQVSYISHKLKQKDFTAVTRHMPPLVYAEKLQFRLLLAGTILLGLALLSGALFMDNWLAKANLHKNVLSFIAFLVFALLCWGHAHKGWRGKTAYTLTITGSVLLTLAYFGSRFVREILLDKL